MARRASSAAADGDDPAPNARRRQPFRPLQPLRSSHSPALPTKLVNAVYDTPPREVILTPRATPKPVKRRASARLTAKRPAATKVKVKSEPPEIDLSRVRPPSPSDDPLLLSGTPPPSVQAHMRSPPLRARMTPVFSSSPPEAARPDPSPPLSFTARLFDAGKRIERFGSRNTSIPSTSETDYVLPMFNDPPRAVAETSSTWSDSDDDDGFNLTGEYTGKYKLLKVPTKADPPIRMAEWGRPVSPFPYSEIMERSLPLSEIAEDGGEREDVLDAMVEDVDTWEAATEPPLSDLELSPPPSASEDEFAFLDDDFSAFDLDAESTQVRPLVEPRQECPESDQTSLEEEEEEAQIDRELSVVADDCPDPPTFSKAVLPMDIAEDGSSDEEDDVEGEDIVKITSDDPKAAARAAAILRMHDYDCILAAERKKRSTKSTRRRRKTIENAGITKSYMESKSQRWQLLGNETSPGSRSLPLLELWRDAEDSVFLEHHSMSYCDASFTLSPLKPMPTRPESVLPPPTGKWNRDCWKCLDKCLVAEQIAVGAACGLNADLLADVGDISKDAILDRFASQLGGESVLANLGPDWSRDNLVLRLDVLFRKRSRRSTHARTSVRRDAAEPRYRGLLQEAMALSGTTDAYASFTSTSSNATVVCERPATRRSFSDPNAAYPESSWLTGHARGPVRTPSRTPDPRPPHPKDQVHLRHASVPTSKIPGPIRPRRLVDLRHMSPIKADRAGWWPTARRSSGSSVRELVKQFEGLDR